MGVLVATLMCAYTIAKVVRDALFITEFGALKLPYGYIGVALASAGFVWLEGQVASRFTRVGASRFNQYAAIAFSAAAAAAFPHAPHRITGVFYVWTGSQAMMLLPHFWVLALDVWDSRRARRVFPILGGFGLLGGLAGGAFAGWAQPFVHRMGLLWVLFGLLVIAHVLTRFVEVHRAHMPGPADAVSALSRWEIIRRSKYIRIFAVGLALSVIVSTLVDFQFKLYLQHAYPDSRSLTQFLGRFYVGLNAAALLFQFGVAGWLMQRFGLAASTGLQPTAVMVFATWAAISSGWWIVIAMRWVQGVVFQTLGKPAAEIYYAAIRPIERRSIKPAIDTLVERWSDALVGVVLVVVLHALKAPMPVIAIGTVALCAIWLLVLLRLNRYYGKAFQNILSARWIEPEASPESFKIPSARRALRAALQSPDEAQVVLALKLSRNARDAGTAAAVRACLGHASPGVQLAAVEAMEALRLRDADGVIEGFLGARYDRLRRAAVSYLLSRSSQPAELAGRLLEGDDAALRQHVLDVMSERPQEAEGWVAPQWIDARIAAGTPEDLLLAARALGTTAAAGAVPKLRLLLAHDDLEVRRATLQAAARRPRPQLLEMLLPLLLVPELNYEALDAVAAIGDPAVPALQKMLEAAPDSPWQPIAARTLARIATSRAAGVLQKLARSGDPGMRQVGLESLARIRLRSGQPMIPRGLAHRLFLRELGDYRACLEPTITLDAVPAAEVRLLSESYWESSELALTRAIDALACWYDPRPLFGVIGRLTSKDARQAAPALEYLGHVLPRSVFRSVSRIFETQAREDPAGPPDDAAVAACIRSAWGSADAWLRACAVRASRAIPGFDTGLFAGGDEHPVVRAELEALAHGGRRGTALPAGAAA